VKNNKEERQQANNQPSHHHIYPHLKTHLTCTIHHLNHQTQHYFHHPKQLPHFDKHSNMPALDSTVPSPILANSANLRQLATFIGSDYVPINQLTTTERALLETAFWDARLRLQGARRQSIRNNILPIEQLTAEEVLTVRMVYARAKERVEVAKNDWTGTIVLVALGLYLFLG
jgi:hypothetical protein